MFEAQCKFEVKLNVIEFTSHDSLPIHGFQKISNWDFLDGALVGAGSLKPFYWLRIFFNLKNLQ
jgi:hypothetical protein